MSRLEALYLVLQAVFESEGSRQLVVEALIAACRAANSWKAGDRLRDTALMLAPDHPRETERVISAMPEGKYKRQAVQRLASSATVKPRPFFW